MTTISLRSVAFPASSQLLILSGCVLLMISFGLRASFGLFITPMDASLGWGRDEIALGIAIQNLSWGIVAALAGGLADRFGPRRVVIAGALFYALGIWLTTEISSAGWLYPTFGFMVGAGVAGTSFGVVLPAMAALAPVAQRARVLGLGTAAGSMGQFLLVPLAQQVLERLGWVETLHLMSLMALLMVLLVLPLTRTDQRSATKREPSAYGYRELIAHGWACRSYRLLVIGFFVSGFHIAFISAHMPAFLTDSGFDVEVAAWSLGLVGLFNIMGSYLSGEVSGRYSKRRILIAIYLARTLVIALFMLVPISLASVVAFSAVMGLLWLATVPATSGLVMTMFGTRYLATFYGVVFLSHQLGGFSGVWVGGWLYALTGSYEPTWWLGVGLGIAAVLLHLPIEERAVGLPEKTSASAV